MSMKIGKNKYGIFNDSPYPVTKHIKRKKVWTCPIYSLWYDMWCRVSDPSLYPSYNDCFVCDDWKYFSNFLLWVDSQSWQGKFLDKDLLYEDNKTYSPNTCTFVTREVNNFLLKPKIRKNLPLGVTFIKRNRKNSYLAQCGKGEGSKYLGYFSSAKEAHEAWKKYKLERVCYLLDIEECGRTVTGLLRVKCKLEKSLFDGSELEGV